MGNASKRNTHNFQNRSEFYEPRIGGWYIQFSYIYTFTLLHFYTFTTMSISKKAIKELATLCDDYDHLNVESVFLQAADALDNKKKHEEELDPLDHLGDKTKDDFWYDLADVMEDFDLKRSDLLLNIDAVQDEVHKLNGGKPSRSSHSDTRIVPHSSSSYSSDSSASSGSDSDSDSVDSGDESDVFHIDKSKLSYRKKSSGGSKNRVERYNDKQEARYRTVGAPIAGNAVQQIVEQCNLRQNQAVNVRIGKNGEIIARCTVRDPNNTRRVAMSQTTVLHANDGRSGRSDRSSGSRSRSDSRRR